MAQKRQFISTANVSLHLRITSMHEWPVSRNDAMSYTPRLRRTRTAGDQRQILMEYRTPAAELKTGNRLKNWNYKKIKKKTLAKYMARRAGMSGGLNKQTDKLYYSVSICVDCLFVCLSVRSHNSKTSWITPNFCACCLWPWLDPTLAAFWYVMCFRFCGWRLVFI